VMAGNRYNDVGGREPRSNASNKLAPISGVDYHELYPGPRVSLFVPRVDARFSEPVIVIQRNDHGQVVTRRDLIHTRRRNRERDEPRNSSTCRHIAFTGAGTSRAPFWFAQRIR